MCLPRVSSAERACTVGTQVRHAEYVLYGHCTGTCTVHYYYGKSLRFFLTSFLLDYVQQCATNFVYPDTWKFQTNTANPQNPLGKHVQREKENRWKHRCLWVLIRAMGGWRKRAKWRDSSEKHAGLFSEQVIKKPLFVLLKILSKPAFNCLYAFSPLLLWPFGSRSICTVFVQSLSQWGWFLSVLYLL